jgi:ssDNA thymidine ADP-ribosyltransferase, DarT
MPPPRHPKICHIVHVDRLRSIAADGCLWCDAEVVRRAPPGTTIGMNKIKQRRLTELTLGSHPQLHVGDCVPFYFCPRSVMLYLIYQGNHPDLVYRGGQDPIMHLEADLHATVDWAKRHKRRWAFTLSNAGSYYFEDRADLSQIDEIDWDCVEARQWKNCKERKQAEFLLEHSFPFELVERIGVRSRTQYQQVVNTLPGGGHQPNVEICPDWYY